MNSEYTDALGDILMKDRPSMTKPNKIGQDTHQRAQQVTSDDSSFVKRRSPTFISELLNA